MDEKLLAIINTVQKNRGRSAVNTLQSGHDLRKDYGFDSLDLAELTVRVEAEFDVDIFADGLVSTIAEIQQKLS